MYFKTTIHSHHFGPREIESNVTAQVSFKEIYDLNQPWVSASLKNAAFAICASSESLQTLRVDGKESPGRTNTCQAIEGGLRDWVVAYARKNCRGCK